MKRRFWIIYLIVALLLYFLVFRRQMNTWGAKEHEIDQDLPGDWLLGDKRRSTQAINIRRDADQVWLWLAQWGRGAGTYAWDYCLNKNRTSADYLLPDILPPAVGDTHPTLGKIRFVDPGKALVWIRRHLHLSCLSLDYRLTFQLQPFGTDHTRLIIRCSSDWRDTPSVCFALWIEFLEFWFIRSLMNKLKQMVESYEVRESAGQTNRHLSGKHQGDLNYFNNTNL